MAQSTCIFPSASEARHSPLRSKAIHEEVRNIEIQVLEAIKLGLFEVTISDGTPMTNSTPPLVDVWTVDTTTDILTVPGHGYSTGDAVMVTSSVALPSPLRTDAWYYVIYVDDDLIKLAVSFANAVSGRPISLDITSGLTEITLINQGSNYIQPPAVTLSGGSPSLSGTARSYLANWGSVAKVALSTSGLGFTDVPTVSIQGAGAGATIGDVSYCVVGASIAAAGSGYSVGDVLTVVGGTGTAATMIVTDVDISGTIESIRLNNPGVYSILPSLSGVSTTALPTGGIGATLTLTMGIKAIELASGGVGYTVSPRIIIDDPSGSAATAQATLIGGSLTAITVLNSGYGYTDADVTLDSGTGATAIASLLPTSVSSLVMTNSGGNVYVSIPSVTISPIGSSGAAGQVTMKVVSVTMTSGGTGYSKDDTLLIAGGTASANCYIRILSVDIDGRILSFVLEDGGSYTALPGLQSNPVNGGTGRLAAFNLSMGVLAIEVGAAGTGYIVPPTITVAAAPQDGNTATAAARVAAGGITDIEVLTPGSGYISIPSITVSNGSGATGEAILTPTTLGAISIGNVGSGYTTANVTITGGGASVDATATAIIAGDQVVSISVDTGGTGYIDLPTVTIMGDGVGAEGIPALTPTSLASVSIVESGSGYVQPPMVTIPNAGTAKAVLNATGIKEIVMTNGGDNYTSDPVVYLTPGSEQIGTVIQPVMIPQRGFSLARISVMTTGNGYQSAPSIAIAVPQIPGGDQATAIAAVGAGLGTFAIQQYPDSRDYFKAWKNQPLSNNQLARPYAERMETVIAYFTNLGYKINRLTNTSTNNTLMWVLQW